jgi:TRAP-type mannitol/chloroaromatic compound transport system permease small subunit
MKQEKILLVIDSMSEWVGRVAAYGYVAILLIQLMEVVLRYIFTSPTIWAWDVNGQLFVALAILGGSYVLLRDGHVRVDILYSRFGRRKKAIFDLFSLLLTTIALALMTYELVKMAWSSWQIKERGYSLFAPPMYPLKTVFLIGVFLLLLQMIVCSYRALRSLRDQSADERGAT